MLDKYVGTRAANRAAPWVFAVAAAVMPFTTSAQSPLPGGVQSMASSEASPAKVLTVGAAKQVDLSAVPQVSASALKEMAARPQPPRPKNGLTDQQYAAAKAAAARQRFDIPDVQPLSQPAIPAADSTAGGVLTPIATSSFNGDNETESCSLVAPSDMGVAVGDGKPIGAFGSPAAVLEVTNLCISVFDKAGNLQPGFPKSLVSLTFGLSGTPFLFDPRALYDWVNHRYIVSFAQFDSTTNVGSIWVAVSQGDDPRSGYNIFNITTGGTNILLDFPRLGQDRQAIYVAANQFNNFTGAYLGEVWLLLNKQAMYAGTSFSTFVIKNPFGAFLDSSQPANVWGLTDNPRAEFFVTSLNFFFGGGSCSNVLVGCNGLVVWAISNPLFVSGGPAPELSAVFIPTAHNYFLPPHAAQLGSATLIDTGDVRITGEVSYAAGSLYAALTTNNGSGAAGALLFKIQPFLNVNGNGHCTGTFVDLCPDITAATIINESFLSYGSDSAYYPTQQPDPEGNVTTVFNFSGSGIDGSTAYISQRVTQPPGTFVDTGFLLMSGQTNYEQGRWGDYTGVAPSGINGNSPTPQMWFAGMYTRSDHNWETFIGKNGFTSPSQP